MPRGQLPDTPTRAFGPRWRSGAAEAATAQARAAGEATRTPRAAVPRDRTTPEGNQETRAHRFDATENRARSPGPCPLTRDSIVVVVARLLPTRRDVEGSPRARRAVGPHVVLELVMNACTNEPGRPLADKAAKHGQIRLAVDPATHACGEIKRPSLRHSRPEGNSDWAGRWVSTPRPVLQEYRRHLLTPCLRT